MNKEDYFKYYIQGSDHYLIPKDVFDELFNEMVNWKEESKELKENYERIYNENCILREKHNINDIGLLDENYKLKQIIDKAIEYLEQKPVVMVNGEPREIYVEDDNKLLDILEEGKNE